MIESVLSTGLGTILGGIGGLIGGKKTRERVEEKYNPMAASMLKSARARNAQINPAATSRARQQAINQTQQSAMGMAANAAKGSMATGGDYSNPVGTGVATAQATQVAGAPYSGQVSEAIGEADRTRTDQVRSENSIADSMASLSNHVSYVTGQSKNPIFDMLEGMQGGGNVGANLFALLNETDPEAYTQDLEDPDGEDVLRPNGRRGLRRN